MTLSPGQKVQPKRSTRISPGGFRAFLKLDIEGASTKATPVHRAEHLNVPYGVEPKPFRNPLLHDCQKLLNPIFGVRCIDEIEIAALDRGEFGHSALVALSR